MWRLLALLGVAAAGVVPGACRVATGAAELSGLPPVADPGPCAPSHDASAHVGLRGYRRFFANDSLIGQPVPCSREDKICFRHNLLFHPEEDICGPVGGGRDPHCDLGPDREEFEKGSGRLVGACQPFEDPCPGYRMAFDGVCYRRAVVRDVLCGCEASPARHVLGGVECRAAPAVPVHVRQPEEEGRCQVPDLRFPDVERERFWENPFAASQGFRASRTAVSFPDEVAALHCDADQAYCFAQGKAWVRGHAGCFALLARGPCPEEHLVAMDLSAAVKGRAEATCVLARGGCPAGHRRMAFDGQCHEEREVQVEAPGRVVQNQFGHSVLLPHGFDVAFRPAKVHDLCEVRVWAEGAGLSDRRPDPPCAPHSKEHCALYDVQAEPPKPEF